MKHISFESVITSNDSSFDCEQSQEVGHKEESGGSDVGDQEDEQDSLKKEVKDLAIDDDKR